MPAKHDRSVSKIEHSAETSGGVALSFAADKTERRKVSDLNPYPQNPRIHSAEQVNSVVAMIKEFGFTKPIIVDENDMILAGHGATLAAIQMGLSELPVVVMRGLSDAQKRALVISDNQSSAMSDWDYDLLRLELGDLAKLNYDLNLTGFDDVRLATFIGGNGGETDPDDAPEPQPVAISRTGDIWLCGKHRIICGDATNKDDVAAVLGKDGPKIMLTDPPYKYTGGEGGDFYKRGNSKKILDAGVDSFEVSNLPTPLETNIIFTSKELLADYLDLAREKKLAWDVAVLHRSAAVPNHNNHLTTDIDYIVAMGKIAPKAGLQHADYSKLFSMAAWDRPVPWAKPVELIQRILRLYTVSGETVFEPYVGSGTTIIAAEMTGRVCLAVELSPVYVDLCVRRWQKFTGNKAVLSGTKRTFDHIEKERAVKPQ